MQLSSFENINEDNIVFHAAKQFKVPNSKMKYERIKIEMKLPNGKTTPLVVATPILFSFGLSERKDQETNKINGYSIPICLWKKDSEPNQREANFLNIINKVQEVCQDHLSREYDENKAYSLTDMLYYKQIEYVDKKGKTKKKKDESSSPVLYEKLIYSTGTKKFSTIFKVKGKNHLNTKTNFSTQEWLSFFIQFILEEKVYQFKSKHMKFTFFPLKKESLFWNILRKRKKKLKTIMNKRMNYLIN